MDAEDLSEAKVYVGTYRKYNEGSLFGKWLTLSDYTDKDDFLEACKDLHRDEHDPEFMFQDCEGIPEGLIGECWISDVVFELVHKANEIAHFDAFISFLHLSGYSLEDDDVNSLVQKFKDSFYGKFSNESAFARLLVEEGAFGQIEDSIKGYLDYERIADDLFLSDFYFDDETFSVFNRNY